MRDTMPDHLSRDRKVTLIDTAAFIRPLHHLGQRIKRLHDRLGRDAVVNQTGNLGHADALQLFNPYKRIFYSAKEAGVFEIALECKVQNCLRLIDCQRSKVNIHRIINALRLLERRKSPGILLDQSCRRTQVIFHRAFSHLSGHRTILPDIGMQHQGYTEPRRIMPCRAQSLMVDFTLPATSSMDWPKRWVRTFAPIAPASFQVSGLPAVVTQIGNSFETGRGWVTTPKLPSAVGNSTVSPRQSRRICSVAANMAALLCGGVFSGRSTKSSGCQPLATASPARPFVRLSITAQSSAIRAGWCSGTILR